MSTDITEPTATPSCPTCGAPLPTMGALAQICASCALRPNVLASDSGDALSQEALAAAFPDLSIGEEIGRGGMGVVFRARQQALDRPVALKILNPQAAGAGHGARFEREARALARLSHPRIVAVHDVGVSDGLRYLTLELVSGRSLRDLLHAGPVEPSRAIQIAIQIAQGLRYAHGQGIIHRDIKPENLLLDESLHDDPEPSVKIADFGLARIAHSAKAGTVKNGPALTGRADVMGTVAYMAPEQARGAAQVDHRADLYALGVVLYEMLTGELPTGVFPDPSASAAVDPRVDDVVRHLLARDPARRYRDAAALLDDLDEIAAGKASPEGTPEWIESVPGGPSTVAMVSLLGACALLAALRVVELGGSEDRFTAAYPLAVLPLIAIPWRAFSVRGIGSALFGAAVLSISAALSVATATLLIQPKHPDFRDLAGQAAAAIFLVLGHVIFHRFVIGGRFVIFLVSLVPYLCGIVIHSSMSSSPSREAYYSGFGMAAVFGLGSVVATLPAALRSPRPDDAKALLRALALAFVGAGFYFHRYLFG